jgi:hypothetical protein
MARLTLPQLERHLFGAADQPGSCNAAARASTSVSVPLRASAARNCVTCSSMVSRPGMPLSLSAPADMQAVKRAGPLTMGMPRTGSTWRRGWRLVRERLMRTGRASCSTETYSLARERARAAGTCGGLPQARTPRPEVAQPGSGSGWGGI